MKFRSGSVLAGVALSAGLLAGCGSEPSADSGEPPIQVAPVPDLRTFVLPLDMYRDSGAGATMVAEAYVILFTDCMHLFGFEVPSPAIGPVPVVGYELRYGLADETKAQQLGYHVTPTMSPEQAEVPEEPSAEYQAVALGSGPTSYDGKLIPEGGCSGESWRRLAEGAPPVEDPRLGDRLTSEAFLRMKQDSRVRAVFAEWSECMGQQGFQYAEPFDAVDDPAFQTDQPSAAEIAVASADVRCKKEAKVIEVQAAVETAYHLRAIDTNQESLELVRVWVEARQRNAARVVAGG